MKLWVFTLSDAWKKPRSGDVSPGLTVESWPLYDDKTAWEKVGHYTEQGPEEEEVLTKAAIAQLRRSIRNERIARMDSY